MKKIRMISLSLALLLFASIFLPSFYVKPAAAQTGPIKIGIFTPETAGLTAYGPWTKQGFELGMIYATTMMGYDNENSTEAGRPYELHYYDTQGSVSHAATQATTAIETDGIDILVGATSSAIAATIAPIAEEYEKVYFITPAAASSLTAEGFNPYIFRIARNNWQDAYAGVSYAIDTLGHSTFAFLAADYSFGYDGVSSMTTVIEEKGGVVVSSVYANLFDTDFTQEIDALKAADLVNDIDYLFIIWALDFSYLYNDMTTQNLAADMEIAGACIDILSMNTIEASLTPPATYINSTGLCLYGYELPNNTVNDWMVAQHVARNVTPNGQYFLTYRVPELFTASAFATAQFLVDVTNEVADLDTDLMINYLESGLTIDTPKGPTYLRPDDHQGLAEMYIAKAVNDTRPGSETEGLVIAELVETLNRTYVAPPVASVWNDAPYVPGGFAPTTPGTTTTTPTGTGTTTPPAPTFDILTLGVIGGMGAIILVLVVLYVRKP
ncbi:MAG: ABC transporter substrate-binding protein [Candidatus Thorarchaeota archaeon]|jgi:branched-chain amino acid transport system substrate-binding protein